MPCTIAQVSCGLFFSSWPKIVLLVYNLCKWWTTLFSTNNYFLISKISQILKAIKSRKGLVHYNLSHGNTYITKKTFVGQALKRLCQVQNLDWIYKGVWKEAKRNPKHSMQCIHQTLQNTLVVIKVIKRMTLLNSSPLEPFLLHCERVQSISLYWITLALLTCDVLKHKYSIPHSQVNHGQTHFDLFCKHHGSLCSTILGRCATINIKALIFGCLKH